jgi:hypothetical protein
MKQSQLLKCLSLLCISITIIACNSSRKESSGTRVDIEESRTTPLIVSDEESVPTSDYLSSDSKRISESEHPLYNSGIVSEVEVAACEVRVECRKQNQSKANLLTATEVNDFKKWGEWEQLLKNDFSSYGNLWGIVPSRRFVARISDKQQRPIADAIVKLYDADGRVLWTARTDNMGTAQLWADLFTGTNNQNRKSKAPYKIIYTYGNENAVIENAQPYPQETNVAKLNLVYKPSDNVDILFIVDATGSMGDELQYLQAELNNIISKVKRSQSNLNIRMGSLVYRDKGDDYLTRKSSLNSDIDKTLAFLNKQYADGGGDTPEAVDEALFQAIEKESWNGEALSRIAFLVLDAPAHKDRNSIRRVQEQVKLAALKGIRIVPLVASGMEQYGEYLMRSIALSTNGTYVTLTDDSGIGNPHVKPTTDYYKVEKLNDLLIRLINEYTQIPETI